MNKIIKKGDNKIMDDKITISNNDFECICQKIDTMLYTADSYCPTKDEILFIALEDLPRFLPFLMWVDETGKETPENKKDRKYLRSVLKEYVVVIENPSKEESLPIYHNNSIEKSSEILSDNDEEEIMRKMLEDFQKGTFSPGKY